MSKYKEAYLRSRMDAWTYATYKSEQSRLDQLPDRYFVPKQDPAGLHAYLRDVVGLKPYSIKTALIRASSYSEYLVAQMIIPVNTYRHYLKTNAQAFKHAYRPKKVKLTYDEAKALVLEKMQSPHKETALGILASGLRISEVNQAASSQDGTVIGKGGKQRTIMNRAYVYSVGKKVNEFRAALKEATGLTPHALRKLCATKMVELGAREAELLAAFGWSSAQTASIYVQSADVAKLAKGLVE